MVYSHIPLVGFILSNSKRIIYSEENSQVKKDCYAERPETIRSEPYKEFIKKAGNGDDLDLSQNDGMKMIYIAKIA